MCDEKTLVAVKFESAVQHLASTLVASAFAVLMALPGHAADTIVASTDYSPPIVIDNTLAFIATPASDLKNGKATTVVYIHPLDIRALDATAFGDWEHASLAQPVRATAKR